MLEREWLFNVDKSKERKRGTFANMKKLTCHYYCTSDGNSQCRNKNVQCNLTIFIAFLNWNAAARLTEITEIGKMGCPTNRRGCVCDTQLPTGEIKGENSPRFESVIFRPCDSLLPKGGRNPRLRINEPSVLIEFFYSHRN